MRVKGTVRNGMVVIEGPIRPPEGVEVQVEFVDAEHPGAWIAKYAGKVDLPPDASRMIDRDLYGNGA